MDIDKCRGLIFGLAAGDRVRYPFKLSLCMLKSLAENNGAYNPKICLKNYLKWYINKDIGWDEVGPVTRKVFQRIIKDYKIQPDNIESLPCFSDTDSSIQCDASDIVNSSYLFQYSEIINDDCKGFTMDVDPIYRTLPLAVLSYVVEEEVLINWVRIECRVTHRSEVAQATCVALVKILRLMMMRNIEHSHIKGEDVSWKEYFETCARNIANNMCNYFSVTNAIIEALQEKSPSNLSRGSYCVDVLKSTIFTVNHTLSLSHPFSSYISIEPVPPYDSQPLPLLYSGLSTAHNVAGASNFFPPVTGALLGVLVNGSTELNMYKPLLKQWEPRDLQDAEKYLIFLCKLDFKFIKHHN